MAFNFPNLLPDGGLPGLDGALPGFSGGDAGPAVSHGGSGYLYNPTSNGYEAAFIVGGEGNKATGATADNKLMYFLLIGGALLWLLRK